MQLLNKTLLARFEAVGSQEDTKDPIVIAKFFDPCGSATWFATAYDVAERMFFGFASIFRDPSMDEYGYFSLDELQAIRGPLGLGIERDVHAEECPISEYIKNLYRSN